MSNDSNISYFEADIFKVFGENPELAEAQDDELEDPGPSGMNLGARIVWDVLFGGMLFVAVVGNLIVLWIVIGKPFFTFMNHAVFRVTAKVIMVQLSRKLLFYCHHAFQ